MQSEFFNLNYINRVRTLQSVDRDRDSRRSPRHNLLRIASTTFTHGPVPRGGLDSDVEVPHTEPAAKVSFETKTLPQPSSAPLSNDMAAALVAAIVRTQGSIRRA